jgi:hypothetical protein
MNLMRRMIAISLLLASCFLWTACGTTIDVKPGVAPQANSDLILYGPIDYKGNWDYVPRTVSNKPSHPTALSFKYAYNIVYGGTTIHQDLVTAFIPTTLIGTPTGKNDVQVSAKLDIYKGPSIVKSYISVCNVTQLRGLFVGGINLTELRRKGLMAVKANIETQMATDTAFLCTLMSNDE